MLATTPLILARSARIRSGERPTTRFTGRQDGGLHYHCRTMDFSYA